MSGTFCGMLIITDSSLPKDVMELRDSSTGVLLHRFEGVDFGSEPAFMAWRDQIINAPKPDEK